MKSETQAKTKALSEAGRIGGLSTSDAKRKAARLNGRKGGRPRKDKRNRVMRLMTSSADENWGTPQAFFDEVNAEFKFDFDAAASPSNAKCDRYYTKEDDSLSKPWRGSVFCNPPYGREMTPAFMRKAASERNHAEVVVMLVPARTSSAWWRDTVWDGEGTHPGVSVRFPPRLTNDRRNHTSKSGSQWPFAVALVIFRPDKKRRGRA